VFTSLAVPSRTATKEARFAVHITDTQRVFLCSKTKSAPLTKTLRADLHKYEFYQPSPTFCRALVIDIDHIFAPNYVFDLPREIYPHAVVFTSQGVQAFWLIEGVPLTSKAHRAPIRFAQDTAELLRRACAGDPAVNALAPSKCRNPLYEGAEVIYPTDCPPYALKTLSGALRAFLRASEAPEATEACPVRPAPVWGELEAGQRNETIFQTIRRTAYRGGDFEAQAYELNELCNPPLPLSEVAGIVRSVEKFMREKYTPKTGTQSREPAPEAVREFMAEIGRKGGSRKTEAQTQALARGRVAGNIVKSAQAIGRKAQIQALKESGYKQREVAEKMGISIETVKRGWKTS
jgi:DNA-binding CsgD family transcriptional regulator